MTYWSQQLSKIIRTDLEGMKDAMERTQKAKTMLNYLRTLEPTQPAPLTEEDVDIIADLMDKCGEEQVVRYMEYNFTDYFVFFVCECEKA
jgi:hypothetical protein